jgi:hypothetical protein
MDILAIIRHLKEKAPMITTLVFYEDQVDEICEGLVNEVSVVLNRGPEFSLRAELMSGQLTLLGIRLICADNVAMMQDETD